MSAVVVFDDEIVPANSEFAAPQVLFRQTFARTRQAASFNPAGGAGYVVLRPGASATAFTRQAAALGVRYRVGRVQVVHLAALALARVAMVTTAGGGIAAGVAVAASPLMPIGPARLADPSPGIEVNLAVLAAGFDLITAVPLLLIVSAAVRAATRAQGAPGVAEPVAPARPSRAWPGARAGQLGAGLYRGADGVRARARAHRGTGAQCPGRHGRSGGGGRGGAGVRHQPSRAGRHAAPVRAELGPGTGPAGPGRYRWPRVARSWRGSPA